MDFTGDGGADGGSLWAADDTRAVMWRLWIALLAVGAAMGAVALAAFGWREASGVAVGVGLTAVNFWFVQRSIRSMLGVGEGPAQIGTALMFAIRWLVVGVAAYAIYWTGWASGGGILAGLLSLGGAAMAEAVYQVGYQLAHRDGSGRTQAK